MSPRIKKLIGTILILIWIPVYVIIFLGLARLILPHTNGISGFFFYLISGTLWAVPVGALFPWMMREPKPRA